MAITGKKISELDEASVNAFKDILGIGEKIIDVTYDELVALMDPSDERLVPGQFYRITDFATVHWMVDCNNNYILDDTDGEKVIHTGTTEPLIVFATSENTLSPFAYSETHPEDIIRYDWNVTNWESKKMFYDKWAIVTGKHRDWGTVSQSRYSTSRCLKSRRTQICILGFREIHCLLNSSRHIRCLSRWRITTCLKKGHKIISNSS